MGISPQHNRIMLDTPISTLERVTELVMQRLYFTRIPCFFEVLDSLYWDPTRKRCRVGIVDPRKVVAGDLLHRLPTRIQQLQKTYDLQSLTANQLLELLGEEFQFETGNA